MSSGGSKTQQQTTSHDPPAWAVPHFQSGLQLAERVARQQFMPYQGQMVAGLTPDQERAQEMVRQQAGNTATLDAGTGFVQGLLGGQGQYRGALNPYLGQTTSVGQNNLIGRSAPVGSNAYMGATTDVGTNQFAGSNPYLGQMIEQSSRDVTDAFNRSEVPNMMAQFNAGGAFGGTAHMDAMNQSQEALATRLGDLSNQYRFQDYQTQQQLAEADINRRLQAQQTDLARNAGLSEADVDRRLGAWQADIGRDAALTEAGLDRRLGAQQADLTRNAQLADAQLGRDQQAWDTYQGRQMQALGLIPGLEQAGYYGAQQLAQQGLQNQLTGQAYLDSRYDEFLRGQGWDQQQLGALANMLGTIQGGSSTANVPNPNYRSATQNALTAAAIAASFMSDEDSKTDKKPMDPEKGLEAIRRMPFESWRYHGDTEQHAGTYSQDFYNALGMEPKREINSIDMFGALGGAVKALDKKVNGKRARK